MVLRTFSFAKLAMYKDLRDNFEKIVEHPIVASLAAEPGAETGAASSFDFEPIPEDKLDELAAPEQAMSILDADASQRQCIAAARQGRSFVMDGPPGTGKSQTIANMIAELIASGRTVLFVSEKAAALDVVRDRLASVGLDEYMLELHSQKTTRAAVATALGTALVRRPRPNPILSAHELTEAQRRREELSRYASSLNTPIAQFGGRTLHYVLGLIAELQHLPQAPVAERPPMDEAELSAVGELGKRLHAAWAVVERGEDFLWRGASAESWGAGVEQRITAELHDLRPGHGGFAVSGRRDGRGPAARPADAARGMYWPSPPSSRSLQSVPMASSRGGLASTSRERLEAVAATRSRTRSALSGSCAN